VKGKKLFAKKLCSGLLVLSTVVGLTACGGGSKQGGTNKQDSSLAKQYVYSLEEFQIPDMGDEWNLASVSQDGDKLNMIVQVYHWSTSGPDNDIRFLSMDINSGNVEQVMLEGILTEDSDSAEDPSGENDEEGAGEAGDGEMHIFEEDTIEDTVWEGGSTYDYTYYGNFLVEGDQLYGVKQSYHEDYSDPDNYVSENTNALCAWNTQGQLLWERQMDNLQSEDSYSYIIKMFPKQDGSLELLLGGDEVCKISMDSEGNFSDRKALPKGEEVLNNYNNLFEGANGELFVTYYDDTWTNLYLAEYDMENDKLGEPTIIPETIAWNSYGGMYSGKSHDLIYATGSGIFGFDLGTEEPVQIMSYINSDINTSGVNNFYELDENRFIAFYSDNFDGSTHGGIFTKVNPEDIPDKEVLVLAGEYINYDIKKRIVDFNKSSDLYRIVTKEYEGYMSGEEYVRGYTLLNNDIIAGNMPDIIIASSSMPIESYVSKRLLANVDDLIAKDEELSKVEFLENVLEAMRINGKLYHVIPSFEVMTFIGKKSLVGQYDQWDMATFQNLLASMPEGTQGLGAITRDSFLYQMMTFGGNDFVDVSTGKCNFDSENFIDMLKYAATLPEQFDDSFYDDYYNNYESQFRDERTLLMQCYIYAMRDMTRNINGYFGEDVSFVGFPTQTGNGSVIQETSSFVLSAKSANLDAAWEFVRYYLTEEYQQELQWELPTLKSAFEKQLETAKEKPYYMDENGEKVEYDETFYINGEEIILEPLTDDQIQQLKDFILSVNKHYFYNEDITNIINEESAAFYAGQKTAEEVAKIIQNRVQVYVDENR